ncbi:MAG: SRPBCC family protein [Bacteroidetes bacterium]|jgi:hypothetical protein|nr:SRPBCC family protein [Bacteroidota bacterium]
METVLIILGTAVIVFILLYLLAPLKYEVSSNVVIEKPLPEVFEFISHLKNQEFWSPWGLEDKNLTRSYKGDDGVVGFISSWKGSKRLGEGEQEIINIVPNRSFETELRFIKPFKATSESFLKVYENGKDTEVIWGFKGIYKRPINIFVFFLGLDKKLSRDFEIGLSRLKHYLEA